MLETLEAAPFAAFLRRSVIVYPLVNALHIVFLGALVTSAALMDVRVLGLGRRVATHDVIALLRPVAIAALCGALITGFLLFSVQPQTYAANPVFLTKMALLTLAIANAAIFTWHRQHLSPGPATSVMALLSITLWLSVLLAGRLIAFFD